MKKTFFKLFTVFTFILIGNIIIKAQGWDWAKQIKGKNSYSNTSKTTAIKLNSAGEIYIAGSFNDTIIFGTSQFVSTAITPGFGTPDGYVAKLDQNGNLLWFKQFKCLLTCEITDITLDNSGNIYAIGSFSQAVTVDTSTRTGSNNNSALLIAKINPAGNIMWVNITLNGQGGHSRGMAITTGKNKDIFISGTLEKKTKIGGLEIDAKSDIRFILARFDQSGKLKWVKATGETNPLSPKNSLASDEHSNLYMTGSVSDKNTFDTIAFDAVSKGSFFVAKLDSSGVARWLRQSSMTSLLEEGNGIEYKSSSCIYITGTFAADNFSVGGITVNRATSLGGKDMFLMKMQNNGTVNWIRQSHGTAPDCRGLGLALNSDSSVFVTGRYGSPTSGGAGSYDVTLGEGINAVSLNNGGLLDVFVAKYNYNGNLLWTNIVTSTNAEESYAIASNGANSAFIAGIFRNETTLGSINLKTTPYPSGLNMFYAKVSGGIQGNANDLLKEEGLLLYPQPASSSINVNIQSNTNKNIARIYSSQGHLIIEQLVLKDNFSIDLTNFVNGIYFIEVVSGNNRFASKLIVNN